MKKKYDMVMRRKIMKYSVMALIIMFTVLIYKVPIVSARVMDAATEHGGGYEMPLGGWPYSNSTNSSITSTQKPSTPKPHVHDFDYDYEAPTCTSYGYSSSYCSCGAGSSHPIAPLGHAPSSTWSTDKTNHWKMCTRSGCGAIAVAKEVHYDNNVDGKCDACEYLMLLPSTLSVSPSYVAMEIGKTAMVSYAYNGDGTVSISNNSNSGVATSQITDDFEGKITVTGVSSGTTTITLSAPQTSLYTAASVTFDAYVYVPNYEVNGRTYETLERAIAAVTTSNQTEIKVLQDVTDSSVAEIPSGKNIVLNTNGKKITFNQGSQTIFAANNWTIRYGILNKGNLTIQGNGELYSNNLTNERRIVIIMNNNHLTVNNGTIRNESPNNPDYEGIHAILATEGSMTTINGGTFEAVRPVYLWNGGSMKMNGGTISASYDFGLILHNDIDGTYHYDVDIADGSIIGPGAAIHSNTTLSSNTTIEGNLNISGGTFTGGGIGVEINSASGVSNLNISITGGTISSDRGPGIEKAEGTGKLTIGTLGGGISKEPPYIQGKTYGITSNTGFYFYDGTIAGETNYHNATVNKREPHSTIMYDTSGTLKKTWLEYGENYQVGTTKYVTLEQAINAISSTGTIIVLQDYEDESTAIIPASKTITLDTRGKTIKKTGSGIRNNGHLTLLGGGAIVSPENASITGESVYEEEQLLIMSSVIDNYNELIINDITIENNGKNVYWYAVVNSVGTLTINEGANIKTMIPTSFTTTYESRTILVRRESTTIINGGNIYAERGVAIEIAPTDDYPTNSAIVTINGGRIESEHGDAICLWHVPENGQNPGNGKLYINSGDIIGENRVIYGISESEIRITGGRLIAKNGNGIVLNGETLIIGSKDGAVSIDLPMIQGENYGINSTNGWKFYDGVIYGKPNALSTEPTEVETGYELLLSTSGDYQMATLQPKPYIVSTHPGMYYGTLKEAIDSVAANGTATVTVNRSVEDPSVAVVPNGKTIILNTNSKEITKTVSTILNQGNLRIVGDGAIQTKEVYENNLGGGINAYTSVLITNEGTLTIDGPRIENKGLEEGYWYPIVGTKGSIVIEDGHVLASLTRGVIAQGSGRAIDLHGKDITLTINGGIVEGDVERADAIVAYTPGEAENPTSGTITINGGKIVSKFNGIKTDAASGYVCNTNVVINGGTIKGNSCGVYAMQGSQGNVTIKEGATVTASQGTGAKNEGDGLIIVGTSGEPVQDTPNIRGKNYGVIGNFNFYDGIISGTIKAIDKEPAAVERSYAVKYGRSGAYKTATLEKGAYIVSTKPGDAYISFRDAVNAVADNGTAMVTVTKDVTDSVQAIIPEGKDITLNLNDCIITVTDIRDKKFIVNRGNFKIIDTGTKGKISMNVGR